MEWTPMTFGFVWLVSVVGLVWVWKLVARSECGKAGHRCDRIYDHGQTDGQTDGRTSWWRFVRAELTSGHSAARRHPTENFVRRLVERAGGRAADSGQSKLNSQWAIDWRPPYCCAGRRRRADRRILSPRPSADSYLSSTTASITLIFLVLSRLCSILVCIFVILLLCVLLFPVYIVCPLSVLLPVLANKDVHNSSGVFRILVLYTKVLVSRCFADKNKVLDPAGSRHMVLKKSCLYHYYRPIYLQLHNV